MLNFSSFFVIGLLLFTQTSWAFDPLLSEKKLPKKHYDFFGDEQNLIAKSCEDFDTKKELTVFQAINIGLCNNPATKISWLAVKKQAATYGITKTQYLPTATINSSKSHSKSVIESGGKSESTSSSNGISFSWLLYDFGARSAKLERDYFYLIQAAQTHNRNLQQIIYNIISAYSNLSAAQETLKAATISEESNKLAFDVISKKFNVGLAPKADVLKIESNYAQATLTRQKAENSLAIYLGNFLQLLSLPQGSDLKLKTPSLAKASDFLNQNIDELINKALAQRPDLKALIAQEKAQNQDLIATNRGRFPQIKFNASQTYTDIKNSNDQRLGSVGLTMTYNFFTGFNQTYLINQSRYSHESIKEQKRQLENQVAYDVWSSTQNLKLAKETEITAQKLLKSATASREVTLGMYKVGKGSVVDIITAETTYANAMKELISARYNKFSSEASVLFSLGELGQTISIKQFDESDEIQTN